jgi:hypothetical protein
MYMEHREEHITLETPRYRITGIVRLPRDGYRSRMTDYLNAFERGFLALTDVDVETLDGSAPPTHRQFVAVAVRHIVVAWTDSHPVAGLTDARPTPAVTAIPPASPGIAQGM